MSDSSSQAPGEAAGPRRGRPQGRGSSSQAPQHAGGGRRAAPACCVCKGLRAVRRLILLLTRVAAVLTRYLMHVCVQWHC